MTVPTDTARNDYITTAGLFAYPYTFRILDQAHLQVYLAGTLRTLGADYTVAGVGNAGGGTITLLADPGGGASLILVRDVPLTQLVDYVANDPFPAETHEDALDKLTMVDQQQSEQLGRALLLPVTSGLSGLSLPVPGAAQYLRWNAAGTALEVAPAVYDLGNFLQSGVGAVSRTVSSKLGDWLNIRDFGAVGDGSDDYAKIQAANDALAAAGGGTLIFPVPPVCWGIATGLTISQGVEWKFLGANGRDSLVNYLRPNAGVTTAIKGLKRKGVKIENLGLDMQDMPDGSIGLDWDQCWWTRCQNIQIQGLKQTNSIGIRYKAAPDASSLWNRLDGCHILGETAVKLGTGLSLVGTFGPPAKLCTSTTFTNVECQRLGTGYRLDGTGSGLVFVECGGEENSGDGAYLINQTVPGAVTWINGEFANNGGWGFNSNGTGRLSSQTLHFTANALGNMNAAQFAILLDQVGPQIRTGGLQIDGVFTRSKRVQDVGAVGDTITPDVYRVRLNNTSGGAVVLNANPTIPNGRDNQELLLVGGTNCDANPITLQDGGAFNTQLAGDMVFGLTDTLLLVYDADVGAWVEMSRSNN